MPKLPGVKHKDAIRAFERLGFRIQRQSKHVIMTDGVRVVVIPRANPVNAVTMGVILRNVGISVEEFKRVL